MGTALHPLLASSRRRTFLLSYEPRALHYVLSSPVRNKSHDMASMRDDAAMVSFNQLRSGDNSGQKSVTFGFAHGIGTGRLKPLAVL